MLYFPEKFVLPVYEYFFVQKKNFICENNMHTKRTLLGES